MEPTEQPPPPAPGRLAFLRAALRLGVSAFGSSQRMQAPLETALVRERRWVTEEEHAAMLRTLDLFPGAPSANTLAIVGQRLGGWTCSLLGYLGFVLPGVVVTAAVAWLYVQFDLGTRLEPLFRGFGGAAVGAILALTLRRVRGAVHSRWQMAVAGGALLLTVAGKASPTEVALLGAATGLAIQVGSSSAAGAPGDRPCPRRPPRGRAPCARSSSRRLPVLAAMHVTGLDAQVAWRRSCCTSALASGRTAGEWPSFLT